MTGSQPKPGPPPALDVEILRPSPANNPIDVQNGMVQVEVRATGGLVVQVKAESYGVGMAAPADPGFALTPHATNADTFVSDVPASCTETAPFPEFRIRAVAEFANPSGNPMDPPVLVTADEGVFEGKCVKCDVT